MNIFSEIYNSLKNGFSKLGGLFNSSSNLRVCPPPIAREWGMSVGPWAVPVVASGHTPREWGMSRACQRMVNKRKKRNARAAS